MYCEQIDKRIIAAISALGGSGIIFNIACYIKNQYAEDKLLGLLLITILAVFILIFFIHFILSIIENVFLERIIDKLIMLIATTNESSDKSYVKNQLSKIVDFRIANKLIQKNVNNEKIKKIFEKFNQIEED